MRSNQDRTILALWLLCRASLVMYLIGIIVTIIIYTVNKIYNGDNDPSESFDYALLIALMPFTVIPINTLILGICYFTGACRSVVFKLSQTIIESVMFFIIFILVDKYMALQYPLIALILPYIVILPVLMSHERIWRKYKRNKRRTNK